MEQKTVKIKNQTARKLNSILGKSTFKTVGDDLFFPTIELIASLSVAVKNAEELEKTIHKQFDLKPDARGYFNFKSIEDANKVADLLKEVSEKQVNVLETNIFTKEQFKDFSNENPTIIGSDLLELQKYLVKP